MKSKILLFYKAHEIFLKYFFWGVFATGINIISYFLLTSIFQFSVLLSNTIAWVLTTIFGFMTSRHRVFKSSVTGFKKISKEFFHFSTFRGTSLLADTLTTWLTIEILGWPVLFSKALANIIAALINYVSSKKIVFKKHHNYLKK